MKIKDISISSVRLGANWRVLDANQVIKHGLPLEEMTIEPLGEYSPDDTVVYSGLYVYLQGLGEPNPNRDGTPASIRQKIRKIYGRGSVR